VEHPKWIGDRSTLAIMAAFHEAKIPIYLPFGENTRCDLIAEIDGRLVKVQCKTGRVVSGSVTFPTVSSYAHHPNPKLVKRDYVGDVDAFAVYCRETTGVYLVPIEEVPRRQCWLRVDPARNKQTKRTRPAADYEIGRVAIEGLRAPSGA
jgi:PD-(D/E)XK endonuclease